MAWSSTAAVVFAVGVGVGEDGVGPVHPAAQTAASIKTANVPAKNDFFTVRLCKLLIVRRSPVRIRPSPSVCWGALTK